MNIRDRLEAELAQCRADASRVHARAPLIAASYIRRRLDQLDRRFPRHGWGWAMPTVWHVGLRVIPAVWGEHDAERVAMMLLRFGNQRPTYTGLRSVISDLDTLAKRINQEFGRPVGDVLSARAAEWGVRLHQLSPDPIENRARVKGATLEGGSGTGDLAVGIRTMHRKGGCGYF